MTYSPALLALFATDIGNLIAQTGPVAKIVLAILLLFSVLSWSIILSKGTKFRRMRAQSGRFLRAFTDLPLSEVAKLEALKGQEINEAKKVLATAVTALAHGEAAAARAVDTARKTFEEGGKADALPTVDLPRARLAQGIAAFELMHEAGLAPSRTEARKLIKGGGGRLNDKPIASDTATIKDSDLGPDGTLKLSAGRKRHVLVRAA